MSSNLKRNRGPGTKGGRKAITKYENKDSEKRKESQVAFITHMAERYTGIGRVWSSRYWGGYSSRARLFGKINDGGMLINGLGKRKRGGRKIRDSKRQ